jgi:hypothetical protein
MEQKIPLSITIGIVSLFLVAFFGNGSGVNSQSGRLSFLLLRVIPCLRRRCLAMNACYADGAEVIAVLYLAKLSCF